MDRALNVVQFILYENADEDRRNELDALMDGADPVQSPQDKLASMMADDGSGMMSLRGPAADALEGAGANPGLIRRTTESGATLTVPTGASPENVEMLAQMRAFMGQDQEA